MISSSISSFEANRHCRIDLVTPSYAFSKTLFSLFAALHQKTKS